MTKYERLYTADEVDGMIARAKAAAAQPATVAQLCEVAFSVKREAIEICKQQGHLEAAHAIQGLLAVNAHVDPATPTAAAQPKQEPVAWLGFNPRNGAPEFACDKPAPSVMRDYNMKPLVYTNTTPPAAPMTEFEEAVAAVDNTLHHAIDHWQDRASEQAVLLRECRFAIDTLIEKKPELAALLCGSTTLGNLKASLHDYRVKGIFDDTLPAAQGKPLTVDCIGLALDLETQSKRVESQTVERAMIAAANGLRIIEAAHGIK